MRTRFGGQFHAEGWLQLEKLGLPVSSIEDILEMVSILKQASKVPRLRRARIGWGRWGKTIGGGGKAEEHDLRETRIPILQLLVNSSHYVYTPQLSQMTRNKFDKSAPVILDLKSCEIDKYSYHGS